MSRQLALGLTLQPAFSFDSFIPGPNGEALDAVRSGHAERAATRAGEFVDRVREAADIVGYSALMAEDEAVRHNRLALLASISAIFRQIADFSQIST